MKKTDKKTDNAICEALTEVCDIALEKVTGFKWITHFVNYNNFPSSLTIICVFDRISDMENAKMTGEDDFLRQIIVDKLGDLNVQLNKPNHQVHVDSEQGCQNDHGGKWHERYRQI